MTQTSQNWCDQEWDYLAGVAHQPLCWSVELPGEALPFYEINGWCHENFGDRCTQRSQETPTSWVFLTQAQAVQFVLRWHGALL